MHGLATTPHGAILAAAAARCTSDSSTREQVVKQRQALLLLGGRRLCFLVAHLLFARFRGGQSFRRFALLWWKQGQVLSQWGRRGWPHDWQLKHW